MIAAPLGAQGVTTAAIQGSVTGRDGTPIAVATVGVTNTSTGQRWEVETRAGGRYFLEAIAVGGPYLIEVRAVGFRPLRRSGLMLHLGERYSSDFALEPTAIEIEPLLVTATAGALADRSRTGPVLTVSDSARARLPNISRDFADLAVLSSQVAPQTGGGASIGGQNQSFNSVQIDGGENTDEYFDRAPGGAVRTVALPQVQPRTISPEAVGEFQVLIAPFDVREGGFAGGLLNAVTRSGTNAVHGSAFAFLENQHLVGESSAGTAPADFTTWQSGGSLGGPILRDRLQYFLSADVQSRVVPDPGPLVSDTAGGADLARIGIRYASAARFQRILTDTYGLNPGTLGPADGRMPAQDLFAKLTAQVGINNHLEVSHHYAHGDRQGFLDSGLGTGFSAGRQYGYYALTSVAEQERSTAHTSRVIWNSLVGGRWSNELILSYERLRDDCKPNATFPRILVTAESGQLVAGTNLICPTSDVAQGALEVTDNATFGVGRHVITLGSHDEVLHFHDPLLLTSAGRWTFSSLDSLAAGLATKYERGLPGPLRPEGPVVDFHVRQFGVYAQDWWTPTARVTVTMGVRLDVPFLPDGTLTNTALKDSLGIDTGRLPSGNVLWSPRFSASYDLTGDGLTLLRGGVGLFSGHPPYRWLGNGYRDTGGQEALLTCTGAAVPPFDPLNQPTTCGSGAKAVPRISFFDPNLRFPQTLKLALGVDRRFPANVAGSLDVLYTVGVEQWYVTDANLGAPVGAAAGEGGRPLYGTIDATGKATPALRNPAFGPVVRISNRSGDRAVIASAQLRKHLTGRAELTVLYAYSRVSDLMSQVNFLAQPLLRGTPLDGTLDDRRLRPSFFETTHRVTATATVGLPWQVWLSLLYAGASGTPFTYMIDGDANADGGGATGLLNDIVYVPRSANDITMRNPEDYAKLDAFITGEPCLAKARGRILPRNACRNAWHNLLNARMTKTVRIDGQTLELGADIFNLLNLINRQWGQYRFTTLDPSVPMLKLAGYDAVNGRGVYQLELPPRNQILDSASRWQLQLGARYVF